MQIKFSRGTDVNNCTGTIGFPYGDKIDPNSRKWQPTPVLLPGKSRGWRSLVGYSPWGRKESDTTERLHFPYQEETKKSCGSQTNCRKHSLVLIEENTEVYLYDIEVGNDALNKIYKIEFTKKNLIFF